MDLVSRRVVGWSLGTSMEATLALEALNRTLGQRQLEHDQLQIHADQGSQYWAVAYRELQVSNDNLVEWSRQSG
jgi:putative transposase